MTVVKFNPARSIFSLKNNMDRLFDDFFTDPVDKSESYYDVVPVIDIEETDHEFKVFAEIPGVKKDDIKITFENNYLTVSGEKKAYENKKTEDFHNIERNFGKFSRTMAIPTGVMLDKIEAEYDQGVLSITIPKTEEAKPKKIAVKVR